MNDARAFHEPKTGAASLRHVVDALNQGQPHLAYDACLAMLEKAPDDPALNQLAATAALRSERHHEAFHLARRSLEARPAHAATLVLAGRAALALSNHAEAVAILARAVALVPNGVEAAFMLAAARLDADERPDTIGLDRLAARFPRAEVEWDDLATRLITKGHHHAALLCLSVSARHVPTFNKAMRRGLLLRDLGRAVEARQAFEDAVTLQTESARAWFLIGVVSQDLRDDAEGILAYRRALALDPDLSEAAVNLGTLLQEQGDLAGAKACYAQAVKTRPETFGRAAQALSTSPKGELWLDLQRLRRALHG